MIYEVDSVINNVWLPYQDKQSSNIRPNGKMDKQMFSETKTFYFYLNCILKVIECFLITFQFFLWTLTDTSNIKTVISYGNMNENLFLRTYSMHNQMIDTGSCQPLVYYRQLFFSQYVPINNHDCFFLNDNSCFSKFKYICIMYKYTCIMYKIQAQNSAFFTIILLILLYRMAGYFRGCIIWRF